MKLVHRPSVRQRKPGHAFAQRDTSLPEFLRVLTNDVTRGRIALRIVVEVNDAGIKRHDVADLINENLERVFDVERCAKRARDLIQGVNLTMRFFDLVVSDVGTALTRLVEIDLV